MIGKFVEVYAGKAFVSKLLNEGSKARLQHPGIHILVFVRSNKFSFKCFNLCLIVVHEGLDRPHVVKSTADPWLGRCWRLLGLEILSSAHHF